MRAIARGMLDTAIDLTTTMPVGTIAVLSTANALFLAAVTQPVPGNRAQRNGGKRHTQHTIADDCTSALAAAVVVAAATTTARHQHPRDREWI